jgi:hypothetical protein
MTKALYDLGREGFLGGDIDWDANTIKAVLIDAGQYAVNLAAHQFLSDIPAGARVATSTALTSKTKTAGVADAADPTFTAVVGPTVEAVVFYQDTGVAGTSRLIAYVDEGTNLPVTPNGGDVVVQFDNGANRMFKL